MRLSLRARIFAACVIVGSGASAFFGGLALVLLEVMEYEQVDLLLDDEVARFAAAHARDRAVVPPRSSLIEAWAVPVGSTVALPAELRGLSPGKVELGNGRRERRIAVRDVDGWRYVVALDLSVMETWEEHTTAAVLLLVALCALLSGLLGRALANHVAVPVTRLAEQVARTGPPGGAGDFAPAAGHDEIGRLADALADYARRIEAFATREREFSAQVSHELRTPLAVIGTSLELARAAADPAAPAQAPLARAATATASMGETLDALMVLGRVRAGAAQACAVDPADVVRDVLDDIDALAVGVPAPFVADLRACPPVHTLPGALRVVVRNLVDNARAHAAGAAVEVRLADGTLRVQDRGPGIVTEDRSRIFESFYRGAGESAGTGLGLAIVQRICEHYGWTVAVDSEPGCGTTVTVDFTTRARVAPQ